MIKPKVHTLDVSLPPNPARLPQATVVVAQGHFFFSRRKMPEGSTGDFKSYNPTNLAGHIVISLARKTVKDTIKMNTGREGRSSLGRAFDCHVM